MTPAFDERHLALLSALMLAAAMLLVCVEKCVDRSAASLSAAR